MSVCFGVFFSLLRLGARVGVFWVCGVFVGCAVCLWGVFVCLFVCFCVWLLCFLSTIVSRWMQWTADVLCVQYAYGSVGGGAVFGCEWVAVDLGTGEWSLAVLELAILVVACATWGCRGRGAASGFGRTTRRCDGQACDARVFVSSISWSQGSGLWCVSRTFRAEITRWPIYYHVVGLLDFVRFFVNNLAVHALHPTQHVFPAIP
jgi:hypothetical protein